MMGFIRVIIGLIFIMSNSNLFAFEANLQASSKVVNLDADYLGEPENLGGKFYQPNGFNRFIFSTSTDINTGNDTPKFDKLNITFYSDNNCNNQVPSSYSVNIKFDQNQEERYKAKTFHTFKNWNYAICANFKGAPNNINDGDNACLEELYQTYSIKYTFTYNVKDVSGNIMSSSFCKTGKLGDIETLPASCTYNRRSTCGYGGGLGSTVKNITIPFGSHSWWSSCSYNSYNIDSSGMYWRLNAQCWNKMFNSLYNTTLCYGDVSDLNGTCQTTFANPDYSAICSKNNGEGVIVINNDGHLYCSD